MTDVRTLLADDVTAPYIVGYSAKGVVLRLFNLARCQQSNAWQEINAINGRYSDGSLRHDNFGRGLVWSFTYPNAYKATVTMLRDLVTWEKRNPTGYLRLWRHRDQTDDSQIITIVGDYSDMFADNIPFSHAVGTITCMMIASTDSIPVGGTSAWSQFCTAGTAYTETTADQFASANAELGWDWREFRSGDALNWFTASVGAYSMEKLRAVGAGYQEMVMRLTGAATVVYAGKTMAASTIESGLYGYQAVGDTDIGLLYRRVDATHYYKIRCNLDTHAVTLYLNNGAGDVSIGTWTVAGVKIQTWFYIRVVFALGVHNVYFKTRDITGLIEADWEFVGSVTNATLLTAGRGAIYSAAGTDMACKYFKLRGSGYETTDETRIAHFSPYIKPVEVPW